MPLNNKTSTTKQHFTENTIWGRTFILILGIALLGMMGGSLLGPVLPALVNPFGIIDEQVGLVLAVYTASTALSMPFIGPLIDKLGRKQVVVPALIINGVAGSLGGFAPNFTVLLVLRAIQGVGIAGLLPVAMTLIGDFFKGAQKVKAMGYLSSTMALGAVAAPMIGGGLAMLSWRFSFLFYAVSIPLAVSIALWLPASESNKDVSLGVVITNYLQIIRNKAFLALTAINFLVAFLIYAVVTFVPMYLVRSMGMSEGTTGLILAVQGAALALVGTRVKNLADRFGTTKLLYGGFVLAGLALGSIPFAGTAFGVGLSLFFFGVGLGLIMPLINTMVTDAVRREYIGAATSLYNSFSFVGQSSSPLLLGLVFKWAGLGAAFWTAGAVALLGAAGIMVFKKSDV